VFLGLFSLFLRDVLCWFAWLLMLVSVAIKYVEVVVREEKFQKKKEIIA